MERFARAHPRSKPQPGRAALGKAEGAGAAVRMPGQHWLSVPLRPWGTLSPKPPETILQQGLVSTLFYFPAKPAGYRLLLRPLPGG